jgi:hypothetical protein
MFCHPPFSLDNYICDLYEKYKNEYNLTESRLKTAVSVITNVTQPLEMRQTCALTGQEPPYHIPTATLQHNASHTYKDSLFNTVMLKAVNMSTM